MEKKIISDYRVNTSNLVEEAKKYLDSIILYEDEEYKEVPKYANKRVTIVIEVIDENEPKVTNLRDNK